MEISEGTKNVTVENILLRKSIRSYKQEQIKPEQLDVLIRCGINAPSAMNKQSWEIRIIQNPELLKKIKDGFVNYAKNGPMKNILGDRLDDPNFCIFYNAPTLIVIANDVNNNFSQIDCGLMGGNILLAAQSMNIGTCVLGSTVIYLNSPEGHDKILPALNLPEGYRPLYGIALGYKNETPAAKPRDEKKVQIIK